MMIKYPNTSTIKLNWVNMSLNGISFA